MALTGEWLDAMRPEFEKPYYKELYKFVANEYRTQTVYPPKDKIFHAFEMTPLSKVRVVIIGQDPYHGEGQANGMCFSVDDGMNLHSHTALSRPMEMVSLTAVPFVCILSVRSR